MHRERDLDRDEHARARDGAETRELEVDTPAGPARELAAPPAETAFGAPSLAPEPRPESRAAAEELVVPVVEETARITKRPVERGVRIETRVREGAVDLDVPLVAEEVDVERRAVNRVVDELPRVEERDAVLVVPVVEEVVVYERKYLVREELHVTKRRREGRAVAHVPLRAEEVTVRRLEGGDELEGMKAAAEGAAASRRDPMERQQDTRTPLGGKTPRVDIVEGKRKSSTALWIALLAIALVVVLIVIGLF